MDCIGDRHRVRPPGAGTCARRRLGNQHGRARPARNRARRSPTRAILTSPSCLAETHARTNTNGICYARIYVPWDAVNDGKGSFSAGTCQKSPAVPGPGGRVRRRGRRCRACRGGRSCTGCADHLSEHVHATTSGRPTAGMSVASAGSSKPSPGSPSGRCSTSPTPPTSPTRSRAAVPTARLAMGYGWRLRISACSAATGRDPVGWQRARRQCPGGGVLVFGRDASGSGARVQTLVAGGFNFNTSSCVTTSCYYLGGYFRELSRDRSDATRTRSRSTLTWTLITRR